MHYLKRGAAPRPLAPPACCIRPPLAALPRVGAGAGGLPADTDSRAPGKIESNMVWEEVSFAAQMLRTLPVLLLWFILPRVSIPESDEKGSQGQDEWVEARSKQLSWPLRSLS